MMAAANPDPIIVLNVSCHRSDAFLIEHDRIRVLELPGLTCTGVNERAKELLSFCPSGNFHAASPLEWLWDVAACPILDALSFKEPISNTNRPRLWWIPSRFFSRLSLQAAGYHTEGRSKTVLDRVMSSYASSVNALIYGRRLYARRLTGPLSNHALLVAMRETPGLQSLPFATDEVEMLKSLCLSLKLNPITPVSRKDDILEHLQACRIFHFAGHGRSDLADPSRNCLLLKDWETNPLTVEDLLSHRLQEHAPFLGYLSACSTAANKAVSLVDEGIHLANAFQLAGFRHVVGTLWEVSDKHCVDVARVFYETLRDEGMMDAAVCRVLHKTVKALRDGGIKAGEKRNATLVDEMTEGRGLMDTEWVPYVHFGV
jgi:hypothetical protein